MECRRSLSEMTASTAPVRDREDRTWFTVCGWWLLAHLRMDMNTCGIDLLKGEVEEFR
ncbi:MAG: hypothetical protein QHG99_08160 [Methanomicrobiales archaeon]|nr:hypothetical protein [Methanomicrobiales archaeon]